MKKAYLFVSAAMAMACIPAMAEDIGTDTGYVKKCVNIDACSTDNEDVREYCRLGNYNCHSDGSDELLQLANKPSKPSVIDLLTVLNSKWPSYVITDYIKKAEKEPANPVSFVAEGKRDESPVVIGRLFRYSDGRTGLAMIFHQPTSSFFHETLHFYEYDPTTGIISYKNNLTVQNAPAPFKSMSSESVLSYSLNDDNSFGRYFEEVDGIFVDQYESYAWDGLSDKFDYGNIIIKLDKTDLASKLRGMNPTYYAYSDIDGDGNSELFLGNKDKSEQVVVSLVRNDQKGKDSNKYILLHKKSSDEIFVHENGISVEDTTYASNGISEFLTIKDSGVTARLTFKNNQYYLNGEKFDSIKADQFISSLGKVKDITLDWKKLKQLNTIEESMNIDN